VFLFLCALLIATLASSLAGAGCAAEAPEDTTVRRTLAP